MAVLLRIFAKLWYRLWRVVWYPLALAWQRVFGIAVLIGFAYIVSLFFESDDLSQPPPPAPSIATPQAPQDGKKPSAAKRPHANGNIQPILRYQNGNSAFADDLLPAMTRDELRYYSDIFYQIMDDTPDNQPQSWQFGNIHGTITPSGSFRNNLGMTCRTFAEVLKVHQTQQNISGKACEQKGGGWCKLRTESTPACDLGRKGGISDWWFDTKQGILGIF